jgi:hypothetical protein
MIIGGFKDMEMKRMENQKRHFNYEIEAMIKTNIESINTFNNAVPKYAAEYADMPFESNIYDVNGIIKALMEGLNTKNMTNSQVETVILLMELAFDAGGKKKFMEHIRDINPEEFGDIVLKYAIEEQAIADEY